MYTRYKCTAASAHAKPQVTRKWDSCIERRIHHQPDWNRYDSGESEFRYWELFHANLPIVMIPLSQTKIFGARKSRYICVKLCVRLCGFIQDSVCFIPLLMKPSLSRVEFRPRVRYFRRTIIKSHVKSHAGARIAPAIVFFFFFFLSCLAGTAPLSVGESRRWEVKWTEHEMPARGSPAWFPATSLPSSFNSVTHRQAGNIFIPATGLRVALLPPRSPS